MNKIIIKFLVAGVRLVHEMHLRQPRFTYKTCRPFPKTKERKQKLKKKTGDSRYIYQNELGKAWFQHDVVYGDLKGLRRGATADKVLRGKAFNIVKNRKYDEHQRGLAAMVYNFFDKKTLAKKLKLHQTRNLLKN